MSIRYNGHYVFVPKLLDTVNINDLIANELQEENSSEHNTEKTFRKNTLTKIFYALYNSKCNYVESTFDVFSNTNLKEV